MTGCRQRVSRAAGYSGCVRRAGTIWGDAMTEKVVWHIVKHYAAKLGLTKVSPHDLRRYAECPTMPNPFRRTSRGLGLMSFATTVRFGIVLTCSKGFQEGQQFIIWSIAPSFDVDGSYFVEGFFLHC